MQVMISDHMQWLLLGALLGFGLPFMIAGMMLHLTGYKMVICPAQKSKSMRDDGI